MTTTWRPNARPPLGLPAGSVRALLAILVVAVVIVEAVRGRTLDVLWSETLMIVLAHYFSSRRLLEIPAEVRQHLEQTGVIHPEPRPLYLPRHSIRVGIILAFVLLAVFLYRDGRLFAMSTLQTVGPVFAYFFGIVLAWARGWVYRALGITPRWWWGDLKAAVALIATGSCAAFYFVGHSELLPDWQRDVVLGLILFYFGSR